MNNDFVRPLLSWYQKNARPLPFRNNPTAYRVWVSEIMLQQTRIEAALPYFERFMHAVPDVQTLAALPDEELMKLWEGLGYYSRARNLKKAAKIVVDHYGGIVPDDYKLLIQLPGIGEYTGGAIASIAYGKCEPAVDGNVLRVLSRMDASRENISKAEVKRKFRSRLQEIMPADSPGAFNEALMELGETICIPNGQPLCGLCPVNIHCKGKEIAGELPVRDEKKSRRIEKRTILLLLCQDRIAVQKRAAPGLLAGMWEFVNLSGKHSSSDVLAWCREQGLATQSLEKIHSAKHIFSHIEWHMSGYKIEVQKPSLSFTWITKEQLKHEFALPAAFKTYREKI